VSRNGVLDVCDTTAGEPGAIPAVQRPIVSPKLAPWVLLLPNIAWLLLFMAGPLVLLGVLSLHGYEPGRGILQDVWTLDNYTRFLFDPYYLGVLGKTVQMGVATTLACLLLGFPLAYTLSTLRGWQRGLLYFGIILPLLTSAVVRTFGWTIILSNNGIINRTLMALGVTDAPIRFMYNMNGVVVALTQIMLPFMVLALDAALLNINPSVLEAARNLGASRVRVFFLILLPLSLPGIVSGSVLVFSLTISAFVTPSLVGGAQVTLMPTLIYQQAMTLMNWPFGAAIAFIMLFVILMLMMPALHFSERNRGA